VILDDVYYEEDTTYRQIIQAVQDELMRHVPNYKDEPNLVHLKVTSRKGRSFDVSIHDLIVGDKEVQDGDRIYAIPEEEDKIATGIKSAVFNHAVHFQQRQGRWHPNKGGNRTKRSRKGMRTRTRKRSRKGTRVIKCKRKRSRKNKDTLHL
jgi:hypothetical protein